MSERHALEVARRELQRLGYLNHRVERFLLSDALSPAGDPRAFALLSLKVGLLAGSLLAFANALALGVANDLFRAAPADLLPLFVHLWPPLVALSALGFVVASGGFLFASRLFPRRSLEVLILVVAFVATGALFGWAVYRARDLLLEIGRPARVVAALVLPLLAAGVAKLVANGLLSLAIRMTRLTPRERLVSRRTILGVIAATLGLLVVVAFAWPESSPAEAPVALPRSPGSRIAIIGLDGVLPGEIDYLLARGALPSIASRLGAGGAVVAYERASYSDPAELWTRFATGVEAARHGVGAIDGDRPKGLRSTLSRSGPWSYWWRFVTRPLGLSEHRAILANRRRAFTLWELSANGGEPVAAINWWATFPAQTRTGVVVAHGAYQLLLEGGAAGGGAVAPESERAAMALLASATGPGPFAETFAAALSPDLARVTLARAVLPDRFYREVARERRDAGAIALYLPAIDLVAEGWLGGDVAFADIVKSQLTETDALVGELGDDRTILLLADPGRRGGVRGKAILLRAGCRAPAGAALRPGEAASLLLRSHGLPQSAELPAPPAWDGCAWPEPPATVAGFGEPSPAPDPPAGSGEYLENLRSLGYL